MKNIKIILASSSPRRNDIIKSHGINPLVIPSSVDESLPKNIPPYNAVKFLAQKKVNYVKELIETPYWKERLSQYKKDWEINVIIAADTIIYKGKILGKPKGYDDAESMLKLIRDTDHEVWTGVAISIPSLNKEILFAEKTKVFTKYYTDDDISYYLSTKEPYDKAGSYAIQGNFNKHISHIEGDLENVIGLPWTSIEKILKENNFL